MSTFTDIRNAIKTKLEGLTGTGQPFVVTYPYHKIGLSGYPSVTFEPSSITSQIETTSENLRTYSFDIVIQQELNEAGREKGIDILVSSTDTVINAFDNDFTLGGLCEICDAAPAELGELEGDEVGVIAYSRITLRCKVLKDIS